MHGSIDGMCSEVVYVVDDRNEWIAVMEHKSTFAVDIRLWKDETLLFFEARLVGDM